jgi:translation initiation factor IF-3
VRLFDDATDEAFGVVPIDQARQLARERDIDLVEVGPTAQPPVVRMMDYGKYRFEQIKKDRETRREHSMGRVKEIKLRPKISTNDFNTKAGHIREFLEEGDKVKVTIMFRGREMAHQEFGHRLLDRLAEQLLDFGGIERLPFVEGRNMVVTMNPALKGKLPPARPVYKPVPPPVVVAPPVEEVKPAEETAVVEGTETPAEAVAEIETEAATEAETEAEAEVEVPTEPPQEAELVSAAPAAKTPVKKTTTRSKANAKNKNS